MTNEEALRMAYSKRKDSAGEERDFLNTIIQALEQDKWIPVSERFPKAGEYIGDVARYYLVQNEFGDMMVARYTHSEYWKQMYQLKPIGDEIVAWMPLPEPYKASPTGAEGSEE